MASVEASSLSAPKRGPPAALVTTTRARTVGRAYVCVRQQSDSTSKAP